MTVPSGPEFGVKYTLTGPDGTVATFNEPTDANYIGGLSEITGLDSPEVRQNAENISGAHGGIHGTFWYGRRPITIQGQIANVNTTQRNEKLTKMKQAANAMGADATLEWTPDGGEKQYMNLRLAGPIRVTGSWVKEFQIPMISADPRIYSVAAQESRHEFKLDEKQFGSESKVCTAFVMSPDSKIIYIATNDVGTSAEIWWAKVNPNAENLESGALGMFEGEEKFSKASSSIIEALAISPDGKHLYATAKGTGVYAFSRNETTGALSLIEEKTFAVETSVIQSDIKITPNGKYVYTIGEKVEAENKLKLWSFERNESTGKLTTITTAIAVETDNTGQLIISPDGKHLYMTGQKNKMYKYTIGAGGKPEIKTTTLWKSSTGSTVSIVMGPEGKWIYANQSGVWGIWAIQRNPTTGELTAGFQVENPIGGGNEVIGYGNMQISNDSKYLYTAHSLSGGPIGQYERNILTGDLTYIPPTYETTRTPFRFYLSPNNEWGFEIYEEAVPKNTRILVTYRQPTGQMFINKSKFKAENKGNMEVYPVLILEGGTEIKNPSFINETTKEAILFNITLNGDTLEVNLRNRTVTLNGVTNVYSDINFPYSSWWSLAPGVNWIVAGAQKVSGTAYARIEYRNAWI